MRIKKFNESNENNVDFTLFDRYINDIRECLLDFERIKNKLILPSDNWIKKQSFLLECCK